MATGPIQATPAHRERTHPPRTCLSVDVSGHAAMSGQHGVSFVSTGLSD